MRTYRMPNYVTNESWRAWLKQHALAFSRHVPLFTRLSSLSHLSTFMTERRNDMTSDTQNGRTANSE
jgi:hypothetical protein